MHPEIRPTPEVLDAWFLTGATASGKTEVALELAERLGAEIISMDSMALYREMDIGTAKPTLEQRRRVPHHLVDILTPDQEYSVAQYVAAAQAAAGAIRRRGRAVLFVGGTPLYLKALLRGICQAPPADWAFRRAVREELKRTGVGPLYERLRQADPLAAARLHPNDVRRIIRALEVHRATGRPLSHMQRQFEEGRPADQCKVFVLRWPRAELHRRIARRVEWMFAAGWVEEARRLRARPRPLSRTALQAVGYRELFELLEGRRTLAETIELVKTRTRRFARRQETWFRSLSECRFVPLEPGERPEETAARILAAANLPAAAGDR